MHNRRLECFLITAEEMNFSRAAQRLYISQQALSDSIQKLEQEYGINLFERKPRLRLTVAGEHMLFYARQVSDAERDLENILADISNKTVGLIIIGISQLRARVLIPGIMRKYHALYPNVRFILKNTNSIQMTNFLLNRDIDIYIGIGSSATPSVIYEELARERQFCILNKKIAEACLSSEQIQYLEKCRQYGISLQEFAGMAEFSYVLPSAENRIRKNIDHFFYENKIHPNVLFESSSNNLIALLSQQGEAVGIISEIGVPDGWKNDTDLFCLPITNEVLNSSTGIAYLRERKLPQFERDFISIARQEICARYNY